MTSDLDTYRAANELIKQHGEDAPIHAAMRADYLRGLLDRAQRETNEQLENNSWDKSLKTDA